MKRKPLIYSCPDCGKTVPKSKVELLLNDEEKENFERFERQNKVDLDPNLYWCPKVNCEKYVNVEENINKNQKQKATCEWGFDFCINCHEPWHEDKTCKELKDEGIAKLQKRAVLKECPSWGSNIEKNEGWNHMICGIWGHNFDWQPVVVRNQRQNNENFEEDWCGKWNTFIGQVWFVMVILTIWPLSCCWANWLKDWWADVQMTRKRFLRIAAIFSILSIVWFAISIVIIVLIVVIVILIALGAAKDDD